MCIPTFYWALHDKVYTCVSACGRQCVLWLQPTAYYVLSLTTSLHCSGTRQHTRCTSCCRSLRSVYRSWLYSLVIVFLNHHGEDGQYKRLELFFRCTFKIHHLKKLPWMFLSSSESNWQLLSEPTILAWNPGFNYSLVIKASNEIPYCVGSQILHMVKRSQTHLAHIYVKAGSRNQRLITQSGIKLGVH